MRYSCYANGFGSTLTLPTFVFFFFTFFQAYMLPLGVSVRATVWVKARVNFRVGLFLPSLLHFRCVLLLRHRWHMNKFSNFKIHRCIYSHCLKQNSLKCTALCLLYQA